MKFKLIKEGNNEFDADAVAVYLNDSKVGHVVNKGYTKYELNSSASELLDKFHNVSTGQHLFYLDRYTDIQFSIGRIIE